MLESVSILTRKVIEYSYYVKLNWISCASACMEKYKNDFFQCSLISPD